MKKQQSLRLNDFIGSERGGGDDDGDDDHCSAPREAASLPAKIASPKRSPKRSSPKHKKDSLRSLASVQSSTSSSSSLKLLDSSEQSSSKRSRKSRKKLSGKKEMSMRNKREKSSRSVVDYDEKCFEEVELERRRGLLQSRESTSIAQEPTENVVESIPKTEETTTTTEKVEKAETDVDTKSKSSSSESSSRKKEEAVSTTSAKEAQSKVAVPSQKQTTTYQRVIEEVAAQEEHEVEVLDIAKYIETDEGNTTKAEEAASAETTIDSQEESANNNSATRMKPANAFAETEQQQQQQQQQQVPPHHHQHPKFDSIDEDSTLASTATGYTGPVSYVEFAKVVLADANYQKTNTSVLELDPTKPSFPDDSKLDTIPKLLAVDVWNNDEAQVTVALDKLANLCSAGEPNLSNIQKHGGHLTLTVILRKWSTSAAIQAAAINTLHKAAESIEFSNAVVALGGLELVVCAMKNHMMVEEVVTAGCGALLNLTLPESAAKTLVLDLQGIQTISAACAAFSHNMTLQKYALWIIQYMSYWDDFKAPIVAAGGLQALAEMMEAFAATKDNTEKLQKSARATMKRLL